MQIIACFDSDVIKIIYKKIILKLSSFYNLHFNFFMKHDRIPITILALYISTETVFCYRNIIIVEKSEYKDFIIKF